MKTSKMFYNLSEAIGEKCFRESAGCKAEMEIVKTKRKAFYWVSWS